MLSFPLAVFLYGKSYSVKSIKWEIHDVLYIMFSCPFLPPRLLECPGYKDDNKKLVECLKTKPMETLMNTHPNFYEWKHLEQSQEPVSAWSPRVDPESKVPYLPNEPIDFMTQGRLTIRTILYWPPHTVPTSCQRKQHHTVLSCDIRISLIVT